MYYAPHKLYKRNEREERDSLNRIVYSESSWSLVCECRCDDNATQKYEDENGRVFIPKYKIVCPRADIREGDYIQCRTKDGCCCNAEVRGEGRVYDAQKCNNLDYMVIYV